MTEGHSTVDAVEEDCVLVGVISADITEAIEIVYLNELEFLAETAGAFSKKRFMQRLPHPHPKTYVGKGKLEEIKQYINATNIELVVFDDELSPSQLRNIERELECKVIDRQLLFSSP